MNKIQERMILMTAPIINQSIRKQIQDTIDKQRKIRNNNNPSEPEGRPKNARKCIKCRKYYDIEKTVQHKYWSGKKYKTVRYCIECHKNFKPRTEVIIHE